MVVGISDNIVRPYVLKGGAELHPLIGFVAAFGALDAIGFYGLFIGPVVAGLFFNLLPMISRIYSRTTEEKLR
jgi:predicted PurR-regulated permease PerM